MGDHTYPVFIYLFYPQDVGSSVMVIALSYHSQGLSIPYKDI